MRRVSRLHGGLKPPRANRPFQQVRYRPEPDPYRLNDIAAFITSLHRNGPVAGIVYCRSRASVRGLPFHRKNSC